MADDKGHTVDNHELHTKNLLVLLGNQRQKEISSDSILFRLESLERIVITILELVY